ncbi:MAG: uroporphyrinogen-III synthase [Candidatus Bipolaricaulota bacterium]|nr:uroporphyrinogen-III synthase [Candidatus Bipolaricaulota bacterium]MBS3792543.1 uroporphyrinogen-III synthase [Candidatus Bipolaricaulota bacterium]
MKTVAIFRPESRIAESRKVLENLGFEVIELPLLVPRSKGKGPRVDCDFTLFTSRTGVRFALDNVNPDELRASTICAIGPKTAEALTELGVDVDVVPEVFSSTGLVESLKDRVIGKKVEVARSSEGTEKLINGLNAAGAYVHETELYYLEPPNPSYSLDDKIAKAEIFLFTSSLMVHHLLELAEDQDFVRRILNDGFVGALGRPTEETLTNLGVGTDLTASKAKFSVLARETKQALG